MTHNSVVQGHTPGRIEQIRRAAITACPVLSNPSWVNTHGDLCYVLAQYDRLREALQTIAEELQQSNGGKGPSGGLTTHLHELAKAALSGAGK